MPARSPSAETSSRRTQIGAPGRLTLRAGPWGAPGMSWRGIVSRPAPYTPRKAPSCPVASRPPPRPPPPLVRRHLRDRPLRGRRCPASVNVAGCTLSPPSLSGSRVQVRIAVSRDRRWLGRRPVLERRPRRQPDRVYAGLKSDANGDVAVSASTADQAGTDYLSGSAFRWRTGEVCGARRLQSAGTPTPPSTSNRPRREVKYREVR